MRGGLETSEIAPTCTLCENRLWKAIWLSHFRSFLIDDRAAEKAIEPGGFLLENQDAGRNVRRRMGKPVRRLRALLPGEAGGRGHRPDLLHPCFLQASGRGPMH